MLVNKDKAIKKRFSGLLMSNQKWKKFFEIILNLSTKYGQIEYKFIFEEKTFIGSSPASKKDVWDLAIDDPVIGLGGPIEYKDIEWIKIPSKYFSQPYENSPRKYVKQDFTELLKKLNEVGKFPYEIQKDDFFIYGYKE
jgi:hypothetical protein